MLGRFGLREVEYAAFETTKCVGLLFAFAQIIYFQTNMTYFMLLFQQVCSFSK